jgi:hypothetical protein
MIQTLLLTALLSLAAVPVEVRPLAGPSLRGELVELSPAAIVVQTPNGPQRLDVASLWELSVTGGAKPEDQPATAWIELVDGSLIRGSSYTTAAGLASVITTSGRALSIRTAVIHAVRFRDYASAPQIGDLWRQLAATQASGDSLVVRRGDRLDQLTGAIRDVTEESVQFESDGETVQARRAKLEGLVYYHPAAGELPPRAALVTERSGTQWSVRSLGVADGRLELVSVAGAVASLPLAELARIDFSSGNSAWLDSWEPESVQWRPFIDTRLPGELLARMFEPRGPASPGGQPLLLAGQTYDRGLRIHSRTELVYRLTEEFRQFQALVGIDDRVRPAGDVRLVIQGDDRELFNEAITGSDEPWPLTLDISGVRRLRILVDFGQQLDIADWLNLCDARVTK